LCSEAIWLDQGRVVEQGQSVCIVDQYLQTTIHSSGSSIDLLGAQRYPGFGERLRLRSIEFNGGNPVLHGEPLTAAIEFETASEIHDAALGFGFTSLDGTRLMTSDTDLVQPQRDLPKDFAGIVEGTIPQLHLQPGTYSLDVGARSGNNSAVDYVAGCAQIEVLPGPTTPALSMRGGRGLGIAARWKWTELRPVSPESVDPRERTENDLTVEKESLA
jgi:lipopolysaccharide transport system ATP-binding protein